MYKKNVVAQFADYGSATEVSLVEQPLGDPGFGEVRVKVLCSALNHMDAYIHEGRFQAEMPLRFPTSEGLCFTGLVDAVGQGVKDYRVGDAVLGYAPDHDAHAKYTVVPTGAIMRKPKNLGWEVAGSLYLAGTTALKLMYGLRLQATDVLVITAAAGGVGHIEAQLAHLTGATVVGIAGADNHDYLRSIGVKPVAYGESLRERVMSAAGGRTPTAFIDNYGTYESFALQELGIASNRFISTEARRDTELRFYMADGHDPEAMQLLRDLVELIETWSVRVLISGFYPFEHLAKAYADLDARHSRGKVVIGMNTVAPAAEYLAPKLRTYMEQHVPVPKQPALVA